MDSVLVQARGFRFRVLATIGLLCVLAGIVVSVARGGDASTASLQPAAQVSSIRHGCAAWTKDEPAAPLQQDWCADLTSWMSLHMAEGMGPHMMWADPEQARETCRRAVANDAAGADADLATRVAWCDAMVTWMSTHMSTWSDRDDEWPGWMGSMMAAGFVPSW